MLKIVFVLLSIWSIANGFVLSDDSYVTCELLGVTHMRNFALEDRVEACYQAGPRIIYDSPWLKVSSHVYMNESTMTVDWRSTKLFIEFYGDIYGLPIAQFTSDVLLCDCSVGCLSPLDVIPTGVDGAVEMIVRKDGDSTAAYLYYRRANISLFVRKVGQGFNFGLRLPTELSLASSGLCVTGCPRVNDHASVKCFKDDYLKSAVEICNSTFSDLETLVANESFYDRRIMPCAHDIFIWKNASVALDHRNLLIDEILITEFDTILSRYADVFSNFQFDWTVYDSSVDQMVRVCLQDAVDRTTANKTGRILPGGHIEMPVVPSVPLTKETVVRNLTDKIDVVNERFIDLSGPENVSAPSIALVEWKSRCEKARLRRSGIFYLSYPLNRTMFVQCDELNKAFLKSCPIGTIFTIKMVCERPTLTSQVFLGDENVVRLGDILVNSKSPLPINVVPVLTTAVPTTTVPTPLNFKLKNVFRGDPGQMIQNPCTDSTRSQKIFFFPHPFDVTKYIQCDDFNNMAIGQCNTGTQFSLVARACEKF